MSHYDCKHCGGYPTCYPGCKPEPKPVTTPALLSTKANQQCVACFEKDDRYPHTCVKVDNSDLVFRTQPVKDDVVRNPSRYMLFPDVESIQIIARSFTVEEFRGFCLGNVLKYRLRAGKKDKVEQELAKADFYKELFERHKGECRAG